MTRVKRNAALLAVVLACIGAAIFTQGCSPRVSRQYKPNILVLSLCSIRQDHLTPYGYSKNTTPYLADFAKHAFVFKNAFASLSWVNALTYTEVIPDSFFVMNGYHLPGIYGRFMRIPPEKGLELDYKPGFEYLKQLLLTPQLRPFYLEVHAKYQHFPYIDFKNRKIGEGEFLSPKSRALLAKYLANPARYSDKLPLLIVLMRDETLALSHPLVQKWIQAHSADFDPKEPFGLMNNDLLLERWKKSEGYADDLVLLQEAYDSKLKYFDEILNGPLTLWGDRELQENTIVVLVGDHGESFMDHGYLTHGNTVYDEMLRFPMLVKFPHSKLKNPHYLDTQFFQGTFPELIRGLTDGSLTEANLAGFVENPRMQDDMIVSRNCQGDLRSVRFHNEWKLIWNLANQQKSLYDLRNDPRESTDVYKAHTDVAARLEEQLIKNFSKSDNNYDPFCKKGGVE